MRVVAVLVVAAFALAGCSGGQDGDGDGGPAPPAGGGEAGPMLHGFVFDPALRPLAGATVKVLEANVEAASDRQGFYGFDGLPTEQFLVVVATLDGYTPTSKQVTLSADQAVRLNFTLEPVPVLAAYSQVLTQELLVECQMGLVAADQANTINCGTGLQDVDQFDIAVDVNLAGAVVEVFWEPASPLSESMGAKLETLELGQLNLVLGQAVGTSPLRISVSQAVAERYYPQGGLMRLTVYAEPNSDETEAGAGASVLLEQPIDAYASLFYVQPPDPSYTIANVS